MEILSWLLVGFIFLLPVIIWLTIYQLILWRMRKKKVPSRPSISILALLFIYGGAAMEMLTFIFETYSGMATLGLIFLILFGPVICGLIILWHGYDAKLSIYHRAVLFAARFYLVAEVILIGYCLIT